MPNLFTPQDVHSRPEAFSHPDRLVRISAIHHAGERLKRSRSDSVRQELGGRLRQLIEADDELVRRYAAVTLAQCQDDVGLGYLLRSITERGANIDPELDECLRNCWQFPFAILLNERIELASLSGVKKADIRDFLLKCLGLPAEKFYDYAKSHPKYRVDFLQLLRQLDQISGLRARERRVLDSGHLLSLPAGKQPGFLCCPARGWFLQYFDESALNRDALDRGREVLFVAAVDDPDGSAVCVYVLEDQEPLADDELAKYFRGDLLLRATKSNSPLVPGLVTARWERPTEVEVLSADGRDFLVKHRAQRAFVRQLVLTPANATEEGRHFFVPFARLEGDDIYSLVQAFAAHHGYVPAKIVETDESGCTVATEDRRRFRFKLPEPNRNYWVILKPCENCSGSGAVNCESCGGSREVKCEGKFRCFACRGTGKRRDGETCRLCQGGGELVGCGGHGSHVCFRCAGKCVLVCGRCSGSGEFKPRRTCEKCAGRGSFQVQCNACQGSGTHQMSCFNCNGTGTHRSGYPCRACGGRGIKSKECRFCTAGYKTLKCNRCEGRGYWEALPCEACQGSGKLNCRTCNASGRLPCRVCRERGLVNCLRCRGTGKLGCRTCYHAGLLLFKRVDCYMGLPSSASARY